MLERGIQPPVPDVLSALLASARLQSLVAPESIFLAPWCIAMPAGPAGFHLVTKGSALLRMHGRPPLPLQVGDLVWLPHGDAHELASDAASPARSLLDLMQKDALMRRRQLVHGGVGESSRVVGGCFVTDDRAVEALFLSLPTVVHVPDGGEHWFVPFLALLHKEQDFDSPLACATIEQLGRLVLCRLLRAIANKRGGVDGLFPRAPGRGLQLAMAAMLTQLDKAWTLRGLARLAGMSRSTFAERFQVAIGSSPIEYLFQRRMERAATLLRGQMPIKEIAARVGYATEPGFHNAFRRWAGIPPGAYRSRTEAPLRPDDRH